MKYDIFIIRSMASGVQVDFMPNPKYTSWWIYCFLHIFFPRIFEIYFIPLCPFERANQHHAFFVRCQCATYGWRGKKCILYMYMYQRVDIVMRVGEVGWRLGGALVPSIDPHNFHHFFFLPSHLTLVQSWLIYLFVCALPPGDFHTLFQHTYHPGCFAASSPRT